MMHETEKEIGVTPDRWVILQYAGKGPAVYSIFAGWDGGYLHGASWKRSSIIKKITRTDDKFIVETKSGSTYNLRDTGIGYTGQTAAIASQMKEAEAEGEYQLEFIDELEAVKKVFTDNF